MAQQEGPVGNNGPDKKNDDPMEKIIDAVMGNCSEFTMAGSLGFCLGYALKQAGKAAACAVGFVFVMAQVAAYSGYIDIKWGKVQKDVITKVDPNGDGKIDSQDVKLWYWQLLKIIKIKCRHPRASPVASRSVSTAHKYIVNITIKLVATLT